MKILFCGAAAFFIFCGAAAFFRAAEIFFRKRRYPA
jgi:hypothetical protein